MSDVGYNGKPLVVAVDLAHSNGFYEQGVGDLADCLKLQDLDRALDYLDRAKMFILDGAGPEFALKLRQGGFSGGIVYVNERFEGVTPPGVNEAYQRLTRDDLMSLVIKHASPLPRILLNEDNPSVREAFTRVLESQGCQVIQAINAEEAAPYIPSVHLVLSDVNQPGSQGGYWLLEQVREQYDQNQLPFIMMSGEYMDQERVKGASMLFLKPFDFGYLKMFANIAKLNHKRPTVPQHLKPV